MAKAAAGSYPKEQVEKHHTIKLEGEKVSVGDPQTFYRLEGRDSAELLLIRPEGMNTCQLAPYKSWAVMFDRFKRDLRNVWGLFPQKQVSRLAVRSINRIDVPMVGTDAPYEDYLALHIQVPDEISSIGPFSLELQLKVPEANAMATIRSGVADAPVEGIASFILDIDLARTDDIPSDHDEVFKAFEALHDPKNRLYRTFLTRKALEEFK